MPGHILVVDDDDAVRLMLARLLESQGYLVAQAPDAREARRLLGERTFDLLVADVVMPGESGLSLVEHARHNGANIPVVLVSGYAADDPADFANNHDGVHFVPKPFGADELLTLIDSVTGQSPA